ncbi:MAG TPA: hypothetical protein VIY72_13010 [Acidimicrobiales bacterium]
MSGTASTSAWSRCLNQIADAGDRLASELRDRGEPDAEVEASLTLLGAVMFAYLNHLWAEPDHPRFMPGAGFYTHIGTPNPDTVYRSAAVHGSGVYRLTGDRGNCPEVSLMPFGGPTATGLKTFPALDLDDLNLDGDGRFEVVMSSERPAHHEGDWWPLDPEVRSLMLRSVSTDWGSERDPLVAIVRLDAPARRHRPSADAVSRRFESLAAMVEGSVAYGLRKVDRLLADAGANELTLVDYSANGGVTGQWYHEGVFELADDEALLVEAAVPPGCEFSLSLTDRLFCTLDWTHATSSLNQRQAAFGDDGVLRVVVGAEDPGVANWLDTTGYRSGVLQCRWMRSERTPEVSTRVVPLARILDHLPAGTREVTPDERTEIARARAESSQLRSLW